MKLKPCCSSLLRLEKVGLVEISANKNNPILLANLTKGFFDQPLVIRVEYCPCCGTKVEFIEGEDEK